MLFVVIVLLRMYIEVDDFQYHHHHAIPLSLGVVHIRSFIRRPQEFTCDDVCHDVLLLNVVAKNRRAKRFQSGALSLNSPKLTFTLDHNGNPVEFGTYPIKDSNQLVEVS